jgi:decaprenyl-phosphate phosphoribosyltransferase
LPNEPSEHLPGGPPPQSKVAPLRGDLAPAPAPRDRPPGGPLAPRSLAAGILRTARPRQWVKNLLVFAAPGAAGTLGEAHQFLLTLGAFGIFCLTASGTYFFNDAVDWEADRLHPLKRHRPVASGVVPVNLGIGIGCALMAAGIGLGYALAGGRLAIVMGTYVGVNLAYSMWLRDEPAIDLAAVASGFVLRAIAGGVAAGVPLSNWFLIVASFGSLFVVAGKRHAEHMDLGIDDSGHRPTLAHYSAGFLRYVRSVTSAVTITAYCLWAFEKASSAGPAAIWFQLSIIPFGLAVLRYALLVESGEGGSPEEVLLTNHTIQLLALAWIGLFAGGVYGR